MPESQHQGRRAGDGMSISSTKDLRERLNEIQDEYRGLAERNFNAIRKWSHRTQIILGFVVIVLLVSGIGNVYLLNQNSQRADEIQRERVSSIKRSCREQNRRHDVTIKRLGRLIAHIVNPRERARAERDKAGTVSLINALAPYRDCAQVVRMSVPSARR